MSTKYVIRWKSKVNGRAGRGTKHFTREEAERLASELNSEYPDIEHEPIPAPPPPAATETPDEPQHQSDPTAAAHKPSPAHALS